MSNPRKTSQTLAREARQYKETTAEINAKMIFESGRKWGVQSEKINEAIVQKVKFADFRDQALKDKLKSFKNKASAAYIPEFSLRRFILAKATGEKLDHSEQLCVDAAKEDFGSAEVGIRLPNECFYPTQTRGQIEAKRALVAGTDSAGGFTVDQELLPIIEPLSIYAPILSLVTNIKADSMFSFPRKTTPTTASWVPETVAPVESSIVFDQVKFSPMYLRSFSSYTKSLVTQSSSSIESLIRADMRSAIDITLESSILTLSTNNKGLLQNPDIPVIRHNTGVITYDQTLAAEQSLVSANVFMAAPSGRLVSGEANNQMPLNVSWLVSPLSRRLFKKASTFDGASTSLWDTGDTGNDAVTVHGVGTKAMPRILDYEARVSSNFPARSESAILAAWNDVILARFSNTTIIVDPFSLSTSNQIRITSSIEADFGLRHTNSVCVLKI